MRSVGPVLRFGQKYVVNDNGCWIWQDALNRYGYGKIKAHGQMILAHRFSYEVNVGSIPDGYEVNHTCHSDIALECGTGICEHRACVNPQHLEAISKVEHRSKSFNAIKSICINGHPLDYIYPEGSSTKRGCKTCANDAARRHRRKLVGA